jgi:hypothetical protein
MNCHSATAALLDEPSGCWHKGRSRALCGVQSRVSGASSNKTTRGSGILNAIPRQRGFFAQRGMRGAPLPEQS